MDKQQTKRVIRVALTRDELARISQCIAIAKDQAAENDAIFEKKDSVLYKEVKRKSLDEIETLRARVAVAQHTFVVADNLARLVEQVENHAEFNDPRDEEIQY